MRVALDTNILAYAEGVNGTAMKKSALDLPAGTRLVARLPSVVNSAIKILVVAATCVTYPVRGFFLPTAALAR